MKLSPPETPAKDEIPSYSEAAPSYTAFRTSFASVSLHRSDRIRLLQFPSSEIPAIRDIIKYSWPFGIQSERPYAASFEFKLRGNPWRGQGSEAIPARILMREIFAHLFRLGWILHVSTDASKKEFDKDTMIFRKQQHPPPDSDWISISFNMTDRMRLIGASQDLIADVRVLLQQMNLLQSESWKEQRLQAWEFKIHGRPWRAMGEETMTTRLLLLKLLETLEAKGWSLYASVDQSMAAGDHVSETDSWYCVRDKSWVQGSAVFHR
ncbi:Uncharacterized protein BP5553_10588 [Venustampulla echinocandica]|uniref:Uncharacterized protein n=1 Tax=Venustampulla echinocandica TaxID=2656787 RepID=A0A370T914_9HELO|nr:Uncharacterized protein BP5553_10588 [Venustampulla echinocandica]RDL29961.1 Uncharacterized protein BP5553_10588 [Venustampulla echinocandica]